MRAFPTLQRLTLCSGQLYDHSSTSYTHLVVSFTTGSVSCQQQTHSSHNANLPLAMYHTFTTNRGSRTQQTPKIPPHPTKKPPLDHHNHNKRQPPAHIPQQLPVDTNPHTKTPTTTHKTNTNTQYQTHNHQTNQLPRQNTRWPWFVVVVGFSGVIGILTRRSSWLLGVDARLSSLS